MQFKKSSVVGVLFLLCLSTDSWCFYVPEKKIAEPSASRKNDTSLSKDKIQICGNALTTLIIEACDGFVGSPHQGSHTKNSVQSKITEDCCDKECPLDYLQNYCGHTPLFTTKKTVRGKLLNSLNSRNRGERQENTMQTDEKENKSSGTEVRRKKISLRKGVGNKGRKKKRKNCFEWKCGGFKSFGQYLFKLGRHDWVSNKISKQRNAITRQWPSLQIGTISPEMDMFGGQPIVVIKKNTINFN